MTHSDAGSQFTSVRFTERLDEIGAQPSIGTIADSFDFALAETTNGLYKTECIYGPDATGWDDVDELELATLAWVHWFNEQRLHGRCDDVPPAEFEAAFYAAQQARPRQGWNPIARASIRPRAIQRPPKPSLTRRHQRGDLPHNPSLSAHPNPVNMLPPQARQRIA